MSSAGSTAASGALRRVLALPAPGAKTSPLRITHGVGALGVGSGELEVLFSCPEGGPVSLISRGREWLRRAPRPACWRAPTENDLGCGFAARSAVWPAAEAWQVCEEIRVLEKSEKRVSICCGDTSHALPGQRREIWRLPSGYFCEQLCRRPVPNA